MSGDQVTVVVAGAEFGGWKSVRIEAGIEQQARSFKLETTSVWPGRADIPRRVRAGDPAQVFIGSDLVATGWVDATPVRYGKDAVTVGIHGRSKTADLVDCCPIQSLALGAGDAAGGHWADVIPPGGASAPPAPATRVQAPASSAGPHQWRGQRLEVIAAALAAPYGVVVRVESTTGAPIAVHQLQPGETVFESIDRMMRLRHVLSTDNAHGDLVFIRPGSAGDADTALMLGENILEADAPLDYKDVFSQYIVQGQRAGTDSAFGDVSTEVQAADGDALIAASAAVAGASRRRVLVLKQSGQVDIGTAQDRAKYERAHRAAKALQTGYTVQGWRQGSGALWVPNQYVHVRDALVGFNARMLVAKVAYLLDPQRGRVAELTVGPVDGYRTQAQKKAAATGDGGGNWKDVQ